MNSLSSRSVSVIVGNPPELSYAPRAELVHVVHRLVEPLRDLPGGEALEREPDDVLGLLVGELVDPPGEHREVVATGRLEGVAAVGALRRASRRTSPARG